MVELGYSLSCEEHRPRDLVRYAQAAEQAGFSYALISDHFHPWTDRQGESPFVWSVIGAIANATERLRLGTGVTCPMIRIHPAIVAHASATCAALMPDRFFLGVGTGELLNEHILGDRWPTAAVRREMLEEAVGVIRELWSGRLVEHHGRHYTVENARLYTLPEEPPAVMVAAAGQEAAELAGRIGDGLVGTAPQAELVETFAESGGEGKPTYGQITVCWGEDEASARRTAHEWWPNIALSGELGQVLAQPAHFEAAVENVGEDEVAELVVCGPDAERHLELIEQFADAGYDHVYIHQVGPTRRASFGSALGSSYRVWQAAPRAGRAEGRRARREASHGARSGGDGEYRPDFVAAEPGEGERPVSATVCAGAADDRQVLAVDGVVVSVQGRDVPPREGVGAGDLDVWEVDRYADDPPMTGDFPARGEIDGDHVHVSGC